MREDLRHGAGRHPGPFAIGPAGQDDGYARTEDQAGGLGAGEVHQLLREHVPRHEVRDDQHVGVARDR